MPYLLSLLGTESSIEGADYILCYYINNAANIQIIRVVNEVSCLSKRIVFSGERILFIALSKSYLEIYSPPMDGIRLSRIACKLLSVNEVSNLAKSGVEAFE